MKKAVLALVLTVIALVGTTVLAQASFTLRAEVPFSFTAGGTRFPAGSYEIQTINDNTLRLHNARTDDSAMVMLIAEGKPHGDIHGAMAVLRFTVNGESGYLTSVTDHQGNTFRVSIAGRNQEAAGKADAKKVVVALK